MHCRQDRFFKITLSEKQSVDNNHDIGRHIPPHLSIIISFFLILFRYIMPLQMAYEILHDIFPCFLFIHARFIGFDGFSYPPAHRTVLRYIGQADFNQFPDIPAVKSRTFHGCDKYLSIDTLSIPMIHDRILKSILRRKLRMSREQTRPDLRTDIGTAAVLEIIIEAACHRRLETAS